MRILLTRPIEHSEPLAEKLVRQNHAPLLSPLLKVEFLEIPELEYSNCQAFIFTSSAGVRAFQKKQLDYLHIPAISVGDKTKKATIKAGFKTTISTAGDQETLIRFIECHLEPQKGKIIHFSGHHKTGNLIESLEKFGFSIQQVICYQAGAIDQFSTDVRTAISAEKIDVIPFYSRRTAEIFVDLIKKANIEQKLLKITALCLSPAISSVLQEEKWKEILVAKEPNEASLWDEIDLKL